MFTGLIDHMGSVHAVKPLGDAVELVIRADFDTHVAIGESVAVNGACLTVTAHSPETFWTQVGFETLKRTTLGELQRGDRVNLERALRPDDRLGGHFVTGHVDCTGSVRSREQRGEFELFWFICSPEWTRQMVPKGSIAVDGISLTLVDVTNDGFSVMLIPHTLKYTTLGLKKPGDRVNLETDLLAKYVQKQLAGHASL